MTLAAIGAGGTAAGAGGYAFFLISDDPYRDECEHCKEYKKNCYRADIRGEKLYYSCHNLYLELKLRLIDRTHKHIDYESDREGR